MQPKNTRESSLSSPTRRPPAWGPSNTQNSSVTAKHGQNANNETCARDYDQTMARSDYVHSATNFDKCNTKFITHDQVTQLTTSKSTATSNTPVQIQHETRYNPIMRLPEDIVEDILLYAITTTSDIHRLSLTCKLFHRIINNEPFLHRLFLAHYSTLHPDHFKILHNSYRFLFKLIHTTVTRSMLCCFVSPSQQVYLAENAPLESLSHTLEYLPGGNSRSTSIKHYKINVWQLGSGGQFFQILDKQYATARQVRARKALENWAKSKERRDGETWISVGQYAPNNVNGTHEPRPHPHPHNHHQHRQHQHHNHSHRKHRTQFPRHARLRSSRIGSEHGHEVNPDITNEEQLHSVIQSQLRNTAPVQLSAAQSDDSGVSSISSSSTSSTTNDPDSGLELTASDNSSSHGLEDNSMDYFIGNWLFDN